jgi:hypothetical protein
MNPRSSLSRKRTFALGTLTVALSTMVALTGAELVLRWFRHAIETSNQLDSGLIVYDEDLGWRTAPSWVGIHRHFDFEVTYQTNRYGYRGQFPDASEAPNGYRHAVLGDSFTFGMGVDEHESFVALLNRQSKGSKRYLNFGVPGFSTDQELLLLENRVLNFEPDAVTVIIYLGNDLLDNELAFPLQAEHAKPYFELGPTGLVLNNRPVPLATKPPMLRSKTLATVVFGEDLAPQSEFRRLLGRVELLRWLGFEAMEFDPRSGGLWFRERFEPTLNLFGALIKRMRHSCRSRGITFSLALLPGKSYVDSPESPSAQFQDYLRAEIIARQRRTGVPVIDIAPALRAQHQRTGEELYYPNEGHLTAHGNASVAEFLKERLR